MPSNRRHDETKKASGAEDSRYSISSSQSRLHRSNSGRNSVYRDSFDDKEEESKPLDQPQAKKLKPLDVTNYGARWLSDWPRADGFIGFGAFYWAKRNDDPNDPTLYNADLTLGGLIGNVTGLLIGLGAHQVAKRNNWYRPSGRDPLYRTGKTMAAVFTQAGASFAMWCLDDRDPTKKFMVPIYAGATGLIFAGLALAYAKYKWSKEADPVDPDAPPTCHDTNGEGPSKYLKTSFVLGTSLAPAAAAIAYHCEKIDLSKTEANKWLGIWSGVGGVGAFFLGAMIVPLINGIGRLRGYKGNVLSAKEEIDEDGNIVKQEGFRNNFIRSGVTMGTAAGLMVCGLLCLLSINMFGSFLLDTAVFGGLGSIVFGTLLGIFGPRIDTFIKKRWNIQETKNSWDYACRSGSFSGGAVGTIISLLCFSATSMTINMTIGMGIGGVVGWFAGLFAIWLPRKFRPEEKEPTTLPWTQRAGLGGIIGNIFGAGLGLLLGMGTGPLAPIAIPLFTAIGSVVGNVAGALYGRELRAVIKAMVGIKETPSPLTEPLIPRPSISQGPTHKIVTQILEADSGRNSLSVSVPNESARTPPPDSLSPATTNTPSETKETAAAITPPAALSPVSTSPVTTPPASVIANPSIVQHLQQFGLLTDNSKPTTATPPPSSTPSPTNRLVPGACA